MSQNKKPSALGNVLKAFIISPVLFFGSIILLFWNEGRVNMADVAQEAITITESNVPASADENLISFTATAQAEQKIGDTYLRPGNYLHLERKVEMYSWEEEEKQDYEDSPITYTYNQVWSEKPEDSSHFQESTGHINPKMQETNKSINPVTAKIGGYTYETEKIKYPKTVPVSLNGQNFIPKPGYELANSNYIYFGSKSLEQPAIGDLRISYLMVPSPLKNATILGKLNVARSSITNYPVKGTINGLYRIFDDSHGGAIQTLDREHILTTWSFRAFGFTLMWFGIIFLIGPINYLANFVPILGGIFNKITKTIALVIALILSVVTIVISKIVHDPLILIITIFFVAIIAILVILLINKSKHGTNTQKPVNPNSNPRFNNTKANSNSNQSRFNNQQVFQNNAHPNSGSNSAQSFSANTPQQINQTRPTAPKTSPNHNMNPKPNQTNSRQQSTSKNRNNLDPPYSDL
ncbi:MAG: hypothetical protein GF332_03635 [Candidatus Moranbacteria bacterium]|nr:hypothetical protein [Candidatus Moranbacteria bacterium]